LIVFVPFPLQVQPPLVSLSITECESAAKLGETYFPFLPFGVQLIEMSYNVFCFHVPQLRGLQLMILEVYF
jgi:hypothetical protein